MDHLVVGLGEVLWDVFPDGRLLGGAPANVAYHATVLGHQGVVASRVGTDELGDDLVAHLDRKKVETQHVQRDKDHPTGTVNVTFVDGDPRYEIVRDVAWDFLDVTSGWQALSAKASAVCFSTLAQRSPQSRSTIEQFVDGTRADCLRVLDVNLRPPFIHEDILKASIDRANVVKYNHQERRFLEHLFWKDDLERWLCRDVGVQVVCLTLGAEGCELFTRDAHAVVPAQSLDTKAGDPVGAGDAFSAALIDGLLRGASLDSVARRANRYAGAVAMRKGGMPDMPDAAEFTLK